MDGEMLEKLSYATVEGTNMYAVVFLPRYRRRRRRHR